MISMLTSSNPNLASQTMNRLRTALPILITIIALLLSPDLLPAQDGTLAIRNVTLINPGEEPVPRQNILIRDGKISSVGHLGNTAIPEDTRVIDGSDKFLIPGLTDTHVHFFQSGGLYTRPDIIDLRNKVPYAKELRRIRKKLPETFRRYLRSGVTAVADVGGPMWNFEVRRQARNNPKAPEVTVAGPLISTYQPEPLTTDDPPIINPQTPDSARSLVRAQVDRGTDFIKIWFIVRSGQDPARHLDLVSAAIDEAHQHGKPALVHATELATAREAVQAGADILVHSITDTLVTDSFVDLLKKENVIYTPTLTVFESYPEVFSQQIDLTLEEHRWADTEVISSLFDLSEMLGDSLPSFVQNAMDRKDSVTTDPDALENLKRLHEAGVTIAAGTDAGNIGTPHGPAIYREFELMREAGLSPADILKTATINGARFMGQQDRSGSIEAGKRADLLLLNSNPLNDIKNTSDHYRIIKSGHAYKPDQLQEIGPEEIVQKQVNAYNARNIEAFAQFFSEDVRIYNHPEKLRFQGRDTLRVRYNQQFTNEPDRHAEIINRIVMGNHILDHEYVTGLPDENSVRAIAHYVVEDGKIQKVYFIY